MTTEHFATQVRELMPQWVKDVIRDAHPPSDDNLEDLQKDLQKVLDEFKVPTVAFAPTRTLPDRVDLFDQGTDETETVDSDGFEDDEEGILERLNEKSKRATPRKVRKAPEGAKLSKETKALERVPEIEILVKPEDIEAKGIRGRAGKYYKDAQTLFVNGKYSAVDRMAAELELSFQGQVEAEELRKLVLRAAQRFTAFRVGKATCFAISKRLAEDWSIDDLDRATSPESLSLAADDYRQSLNAARKWLRIELKVEQADAPANELT